MSECFRVADSRRAGIIFQTKFTIAASHSCEMRGHPLLCQQCDAKLFNNRLVSQRFILLARSPGFEATNSTSHSVEERE